MEYFVSVIEVQVTNNNGLFQKESLKKCEWRIGDFLSRHI